MPKLTFTFVTNFFNHVTLPSLLPILINPNIQNYKKNMAVSRRPYSFS